MNPQFITRYIPDLIADVVTATDTALHEQVGSFGYRVQFDWGHYLDVARNLTAKDAGPSQLPKYPLVWLVMDFEESMGKSLNNYAKLPALQIIIANASVQDIPMSQRRDQTFLPILYPIYQELINQFALSAVFHTPQALQIEHTKIDRPCWGGVDAKGNSKELLFNDYIDAIQIKNLQLSVMRKLC